MVDYAAVKDAARTQVTSLAPRLLPQGQRRGDWWVARCPWRDDKRASLYLSLTTARYQDYGAADSGTIIDLVMKLDGCDHATAAATLASLLGLSPDAPRAVRPEPPGCDTCRHRWLRWPRRSYCTVVVVPMFEEPMPCGWARRSGQRCGPMGVLHQGATNG